MDLFYILCVINHFALLQEHCNKKAHTLMKLSFFVFLSFNLNNFMDKPMVTPFSIGNKPS